MPASFFGIILTTAAVAAVVLGFSGFSMYVLGAENPATLMWGWKTYASLEQGVSVKHPEGFSANPGYAYTGLGKSRTIRGVSFALPESYTAGTNLSSLSKISIEMLPSTGSCVPERFLYKPKALQSMTDEGRRYEFGMEREVKKGVVREERVYAFADASPCVAVRYTIYSGLIEVDDAAAVKAFDEKRLMETFDTMRRSVVLMQH